MSKDRTRDFVMIIQGKKYAAFPPNFSFLATPGRATIKHDIRKRVPTWVAKQKEILNVN